MLTIGKAPHSFRSLYFGLVAALATAMGCWVYFKSTRSWLDCPTGHCPDPLSLEYLLLVQRNSDTAPRSAVIAFITVLALGTLLWVFALGVRRIRRRSDPSESCRDQ